MNANQNSTADASAYILLMLLQRLERNQPGLLDDMIAGVRGDRSATPKDIPDYERVDATFDAALGILCRANDLLRLAGESGPANALR